MHALGAQSVPAMLSSASDAADRRHGRAHRPREDVARPGAHRQGHRSLPEEQRRGISIDLGYAPLELPRRPQLSVIDVPGHERFVRTMVAGATGIDLFLLVVDAGEGARPADARAPRDPAAARDRARRRRAHEGRCGRRRDGGARRGEEARELVAGAEVVRVRARRRGGPRRASRRARAGRRLRRARARGSPDAALRRPLLLRRRLRDGGHGHALVGLDRRWATSCGSSRRAS